MSRLTSFTCQPILVIMTSLTIHHSLTPSSKPTFQQILPTLALLLYSLDYLHDNGTGLGLSCLSVYF